MQRILVIDDDYHILMMIKKMLERVDFDVGLALDGNEGLELFKSTPVDLVICDIIMPEKEGLETIREIRRLKSDMKIIAMSGGGRVSSDNYLNNARAFGAARVLEKPFSQKQMISAVQDLLSEAFDN